MVSDGWKPVISNLMIQATCGKGMPFYEAYMAAKSGTLPAKDKGVLSAQNIQI